MLEKPHALGLQQIAQGISDAILARLGEAGQSGAVTGPTTTLRGRIWRPSLVDGGGASDAIAADAPRSRT